MKNEDEPVTIEEIQDLRNEILLMHESLAKDVISHAPFVQKVVDIFVDKGLDRTWVEKLLAPVVGSSFEDDEVMLVSYLLEELDALLPILEEPKVIEKKIHIVVGGTGIGKSSLIGKLGARYTYFLERSYKVAFFNFDHHKVGAIEQLDHYADAMDIPMIAFEDFVDSEYDIILVDTAGGMGKNLSELEGLIELIQKNTSYKVEVSLVLSATGKERDLKRTFNTFKGLELDNFIFTKLDETYDLSDMINFLMNNEKPVSYLSIGQEIPEDLMVATKEYLLKQFMDEKDRDNE